MLDETNTEEEISKEIERNTRFIDAAEKLADVLYDFVAVSDGFSEIENDFDVVLEVKELIHRLHREKMDRIQNLKRMRQCLWEKS